MALYLQLFAFLAGFSMFVSRSNSQGVCPKKWTHLQGSCYRISSNTLSWNAAKKACERMGSTLAMVTSKVEQQALSSKIAQGTWIGLLRDPKDNSSWIWADGTPVNYSNWKSGEPNNYGGYEGCGEMYPPAYKGKWNDAQCHSTLQYICEITARCKKLSMGSRMRVSPSHCLSSNQGHGSTCTISCIRGYQLSGPSSLQCGKGGVWRPQLNKISCNVIKCPALTISALVKTSPGSCVTSPMKYNTTCSFSCPHGYQLKGPSNKQCRLSGQWSDSAKKVSCIAPGVNVQCNSNNMTIIIPKSLLRGIDREHLRLREATCKATETSAYFSLVTPITGCNTTRRNTPSAIVYTNAVLEIPVPAKEVVTRVRELEIQFSCFYSKYGVVSSVGWKPRNRKLVFSDEAKGNFTLTLNMFPDKRFVSPYKTGDFPVAVVLRKRLFFEVSVTSSDKQLSIIADRCLATPTQNQKNSPKYVFIAKGCPSDLTVKYHTSPSVSAQRFSLEAFKFIADHPFVFIHCHLIVCNSTNQSSECAKKCSSIGRRRREVNSHMTEDVYKLAQGPIHLARQKREGTGGNVEQSGGKLGSSTSLMLALLLMCLTGLAGTVLLAFRRSRDKSVGYSLLVTGDYE